jgi:hypothetical protein
MTADKGIIVLNSVNRCTNVGIKQPFWFTALTVGNFRGGANYRFKNQVVTYPKLQSILPDLIKKTNLAAIYLQKQFYTETT